MNVDCELALLDVEGTKDVSPLENSSVRGSDGFSSLMPPSHAETDVKILVDEQGQSERESLLHALSPWPSQPLKANATRQKYSMWFYFISIIILMLLLSMIAFIIAIFFFFPRIKDRSPSSAQRVHFISAEYVLWNFTDGENKCYGNGFGGPGPNNDGSNLSTIRGSFRKAIFRAYSDIYFNTPLKRERKWQVSKREIQVVFEIDYSVIPCSTWEHLDLQSLQRQVMLLKSS